MAPDFLKCLLGPWKSGNGLQGNTHFSCCASSDFIRAHSQFISHTIKWTSSQSEFTIFENCGMLDCLPHWITSLSSCWEMKVSGPLQNAVSLIWVEELCCCWLVVWPLMISCDHHSLLDVYQDWSDVLFQITMWLMFWGVTLDPAGTVYIRLWDYFCTNRYWFVHKTANIPR